SLTSRSHRHSGRSSSGARFGGGLLGTEAGEGGGGFEGEHGLGARLKRLAIAAVSIILLLLSLSFLLLRPTSRHSSTRGRPSNPMPPQGLHRGPAPRAQLRPPRLLLVPHHR
ncbi:unnamed protein product, partial [Urochloa humidicola]